MEEDILSLLQDTKSVSKKDNNDYELFEELLSNNGTTLTEKEKKVFNKKKRRTQEEIKADKLRKYQKEYQRKATEKKKLQGIKHVTIEIGPEVYSKIEKIRSLTGQSIQSILLKGCDLVFESLNKIVNGDKNDF